jgi:hypothetical protein
MPYWRLFYHLVWTTKQRVAWLTPEVEPVIHDLLRAKAIGLGATDGGSARPVAIARRAIPSLCRPIRL